MPRAGPETGNCTTKKFASRGSPDYVKLFWDSGELRVSGMGLFYDDKNFIRLGKGTVVSV